MMTPSQPTHPLIPAEAGIQFEAERPSLWIPNQVWDERKRERE